MKFRLKMFLSCLTITSPALSQQWADTGDVQLRRDVELLKAYNVIEGPVNSWPMSWRQISKGILDNSEQNYPVYVLQAIERIKSKNQKKDWVFKSDLRFTNEQRLVRGFDDTARSEADLTLSSEYHSNNIDVNISVNYKNEQYYNDVTFDGSYISAVLGDWSLYAGAIDRWWGPGQDNTLLLSNNARPMVSLGLRRNNSKAFKTKLLSWMGPWTWDMFVANMGHERHIPDALMAGMRLGFEPLHNFEVGLSRTMQLCGKNRPCGFKTWASAIISVGDLDNTGSFDEPGNQLASIDFAYNYRFGNKTFRVYIEGTAEDQHIVTPFQYSRLFGATLTSPIGKNGDTLSFNSEWSDSGNVEIWFFGFRKAGTMYGHHIYRTGHRYSGRSLGHSFDNDSKLISLSTTYTLGSGASYNLNLRTGTINWDDTDKNIVSLTSQKYKSAEFSVSNTFDFGYVKLQGAIQSGINTLTQGRIPAVTAGFIWQRQF